MASGFSQAAVEKPNVIFIKTDDQRCDSLSMTGHPVTKTPNIDRLAKEGVFFANAFITSPICGPSRANFFTGQWERKNRHGFTYVSRNPISTELFDNSWLMMLIRAGYFTGYISKHHVSIGPIKGCYKNVGINQRIRIGESYAMCNPYFAVAFYGL